MGLLMLILQGIRLIVFADVILSWVMRDPTRFPRDVVGRITAPLYAPIHAVLDPRKTGGFDLAPVIILVLISLVTR